MSRVKALVNILLYFGCQIFLSSAVLYIFTLFNPGISIEELISNKNVAVIYLGLINSISLLILIVVNYKYIKDKMRYAIANIKQTFNYAFLGYFILVCALFVFGIVKSIFKLESGTPVNEQMIDSMINNSNFIFSIIVIGIITPFLEEFIFRVSLLGLFTNDQYRSNWIPYILAAIVFTFIHDTTIITDFGSDSILNFFSYFIPSIALCATYKISNHNYLSVTLIHIVNNLLAVIFTGLI